MSFGKRLKKARENKGLTQKELADLLFLGESTISFYEADKREPKFEILEKLSDVLGVSVDYLLGRTDDPRPPRRLTITETGRGRDNVSVKKFDKDGKPIIESDPSTPSWWYRDTPPTDVELEELLKTANIYFDGAPLNEEDKEDIVTYLKVKWEREKKKREKEGKK